MRSQTRVIVREMLSLYGNDPAHKSTIFVLLLNKGLLVVQTLQQRFHEDKVLV
jgi:hypothetical protein